MAEDQVTATVDQLIPGGEGLARLDGLAVFVPGVLPGELFSAAVVKRKGSWIRTGEPVILRASPERRRPFCPLFGTCGGCSWQYMSYPAQLEGKVSLVRDALTRQGSIPAAQVPVFTTVPSPPVSYRSRIRPSVMAGGRAGFLAAGSDRTVAVDTCPVAAPGVNRFFSEVPVQLAPGDRPVVFGDRERFWAAGVDPEARAAVSGKEFRFPPDAFFQSNLLILPDLVDFTLGHPEPGARDQALDLYGGVGLFGAFLADRYQNVIGVDNDPRTGSRWMDHVGSRGEFHAMALEEWVLRRAPVQRSPARPDLIVVDPPRTGLSEAVRRRLIALGSPLVSYVSCDPVTQARDLKDFLAAGYAIEAFGIFDLYPQTPHVETVARLRRPEL